ncbi:type II secretion system protein [Candidatus Saccharibacteria bacterium]|nr:type II secretion system protein [Candidatus Saccharibacteria bacterium]
MITNKLRGDTLIEVTLAVGIFSMVAIAAVAVLSGGTSSAQTALEATLAREEIDAQSEAIRFIQSAYLAERDMGGGAYKALYEKIASLAGETSGYTGTNNKSCDDMYNNNVYKTGNAFIINTHKLSGYADRYNNASDKNEVINEVLIVSDDDNREEGRNKLFRKTQTYPHLIYGNNATNTDKDKLINDDLGESVLYAAAGIYVVAVADNGTTKIVDDKGDLGNKKGFDDFYVQTCWYGSGSDTASTISTVIRLYNPQADIAQGTSIYTIYYNGNEDADAHSGGAMSRTYNMTNSEQPATVLANSYTKLCYDPITAKDIWPDKAAADTRPIWTTKSYYEEWKNANPSLFNPNGENLYGVNVREYSGRKGAMDAAHDYLRKKEESYIEYLRDKLKPGGDAYYFEGDEIKIPENKGSNQYITLFAQWHKDYNHNVCSPLYVGYTNTGASPNLAGQSEVEPNESYSGSTQGFIIPDERAWYDKNKGLPAVAAVKERKSGDYIITRSRLKFPVSECKTSSNDWIFISDKDSNSYNSVNNTMELIVFGGQKLKIKNITNFNEDDAGYIKTAKFANGKLSILKGNKEDNNSEPAAVFFNISCLAPSMQADVTMEFCKKEAYGKEILVRDERDGELYTIEYIALKSNDDFINSIQSLLFGGLDLLTYVPKGQDTDGFCMMTQNLRFEGRSNKGKNEKDIQYSEREKTNEDGTTEMISVGSNMGKNDEGINLVETIPGKEIGDGYTWKSEENGKKYARYVSSQYIKEGIAGISLKKQIEDLLGKGYHFSTRSQALRRADWDNRWQIDDHGIAIGGSVENVDDIMELARKDIGTWYNFNAASAGYEIKQPEEPGIKIVDLTSKSERLISGSVGMLLFETKLTDICPAGWHIMHGTAIGVSSRFFAGATTRLARAGSRMHYSIFYGSGGYAEWRGFSHPEILVANGENNVSLGYFGGEWGKEARFYNYVETWRTENGRRRTTNVETVDGELLGGTGGIVLNTPNFKDDPGYEDESYQEDGSVTEQRDGAGYWVNYPTYRHVRCIKSDESVWGML